MWIDRGERTGGVGYRTCITQEANDAFSSRFKSTSGGEGGGGEGGGGVKSYKHVDTCSKYKNKERSAAVGALLTTNISSINCNVFEPTVYNHH